MTEMQEVQRDFLRHLAASARGVLGPGPDYQGDCLHLSAQDLQYLVAHKLVSRIPLRNPRDTDYHKDKPPYLRFTHRYKIRVAGRKAVEAPSPIPHQQNTTQEKT